MSDSPSPINLNTPDVSGRAPGEILRAAREAQGLSLDHLAATLKVAPTKLAALEEGRLDQLPDANFARALAQTMCRVLKVDATEVLAGLPAARLAPLASDKPVLNQPFKESRLTPKMFDAGGESGMARWLRPQWLAPILLLVAAAVIYLLPDSFEWPRWQGAALPADPAASQASAPDQTAYGSLPVPAASDAMAPEQLALGASDAVLSASSIAESAQPDSGAMPLAPATNVAPSAVASQASVPPLGNAVVVGDTPLVLKVSADSWVEVTDGGGATQVSRIVRAGESLSLGGASPWKLRIGHAGGVQVALRGQPVDLTPFTRNNVARFELK